jgi:hypothetical protein
MKKVLFFLLTQYFVPLLLSVPPYQPDLVFLYDESGSCIRKYLTVVMSYAPTNSGSGDVSDEDFVEEAPQPQSDLLNGLKITIYPTRRMVFCKL